MVRFGSRTPLEWPVDFHSRLLLDTIYRSIVCILSCYLPSCRRSSNPLTNNRNLNYCRSVGITAGIAAQSLVRFEVCRSLKPFCKARVEFWFRSMCSMKRSKEVKFRSFVTVGKAAQSLSYSSGSIRSRSGSFIRSFVHSFIRSSRGRSLTSSAATMKRSLE
jgi:hypothetical protein